jgi:hypothetical protein
LWNCHHQQTSFRGLKRDYDLPCSLEELVLHEENEKNPHEEHKTNPHFLTQQELNDLIRDLGLKKCNAEILTS